MVQAPLNAVTHGKTLMADAKTTMDWLAFTSEMTKALAWPISIIVVVSILHKRIAGAIDRMRSIKYGETELSFGSELAQAQTIAENAGVTLLRPSNSFAPSLLNLASTSPTAAIIEGWKLLETEIKNLAERAGVTWRSPSQTISALDKMDLLPNSLAEILRYLTSMRNKAVHAPSSDVTEGEAIEFLMLSRSIAERVKQVDAAKARKS